MSTLQEFKCPCCNGSISFDTKLQKMKCPYCDTEFSLETLQQYDSVKIEEEDQFEWDVKPGQEWAENETDGLLTYVCNSCGGEIVADENMAAASCPFCGSPIVVKEKLGGVLKPDLVIPFKLDKKAAKEGLKQHYKGKTLLPKEFKSENHIEEIKGVYVPFWLFDADVDGEVRYNATKVRMWSDSEYDYTETKYYRLYRKGHVRFENIPVDGSSKMPDDMMESIEPYDLKDAVDFQTAYLAGFLADKYDVDADSSIDRANTRVKKSTEDAFMTNCGKYDTVTCEDSAVQIQNGTAKYALYPVWILNTKWKGENYSFAMNGQTGKFVGNLPENKSLVYLYYVVVTLLGSVLAYIVILIMSWGK